MSDLERLLAEQAHYTPSARASTTIDGFGGRYDHGRRRTLAGSSTWPPPTLLWRASNPTGDVPEFACGTGLWTERLLGDVTSVTAIYGSPEMFELCQTRVADPRVRYVQADPFAWEPEQTYDPFAYRRWRTGFRPCVNGTERHSSWL